MHIITINGKITQEEKETQLNYDNISKTWRMYSVVSKHYNKAIKCGWEPVKKYVYTDGTVAGYELTAPGRCITIRNVEKRKMSDKQMLNLTGSNDEDE